MIVRVRALADAIAGHCLRIENEQLDKRWEREALARVQAAAHAMRHILAELTSNEVTP